MQTFELLLHLDHVGKLQRYVTHAIWSETLWTNVMWTHPGDRDKESGCKDYLSWKIDITTAIMANIWSRRRM